MIDVRNLRHDYEGKGTFAVDDVSFSIPDGTIFGFLGPSGAGKSTVQGLMTGLLRIRHGAVEYDGTDIRKQGREFFEKIGLSFEHPNVYGKLTGYENLRFFAGLFRGPTEDPMKLLDAVGLREAAKRRASAYSKGMKQRLVFARALVNRPRILFLDEPTSGLDPSTAEMVKDIIRAKRAEGCTVFLTTHNMQIAEDLCDTVAFINDGKIVALDTPRALKLRYGTRAVKVEYRDNGSVRSELVFPDSGAGGERLGVLIGSGTMETVHSQEATLERIFIELTGRSLA